MSEIPRANETDLVVIRAALNRWAGPVQRLDVEGKKQELADREELTATLLRLYALSRASISESAAPPVRTVDVERVLSCFRRLSLMGGATPSAIVAYCERAAAADDNHTAHRADPLMLRYVLTFHLEPTQAWFAANDEARLRYLCERADLAGIRAWFERVSAKKEEMPKDSCQYLRSILLRFWNRRMGDMETLAFEQAVLEVRLFEAMGWENTRMFCALLRRIGGGNLPAFGAYLSSDDIEEALVLHESLDDQEQCAHFRALATVHDRRLLGELERAVFANAAHFDAAMAASSTTSGVAPPAEVSPSPPPKASRLRRLLGFKPEAA